MLVKQSCQIAGTDANLLCHGSNYQFLLNMRLHILLRLADDGILCAQGNFRRFRTPVVCLCLQAKQQQVSKLKIISAFALL